MEPDWYEVLGVSSAAPAEQIKSAYRSLALQLHPDRNPDDPGAAKRFMQVNAAYEVLGDARQRQDYDDERARKSAAAAKAGQDPAPGFKPKPAWRPPPEPVKEPDSSRGLTGRQAVGRAIIGLGLLLALRGFGGAYRGASLDVLPAWLLPTSQDSAFLQYLGGMAVIFVGMGTLMRRGGEERDPSRPWWWF